MNWKKINQEYPKVCNELEKWLGSEKVEFSAHDFEYTEDHLRYIDEYLHPQIFKTRDLYDFFDEQGIYINVYPYIHLDTFQSMEADIYVTYTDGDIDKISINSLELDNPRSEAEIDAFTKAFEILENKLK